MLSSQIQSYLISSNLIIYLKPFCRYPKGSDRRLEIYQAAVGQLGLACYIKGAMTSLLFLAHEFHDDFEAGVLTNTNCGGNVVTILPTMAGVYCPTLTKGSK